jgi:hypothetical protein
MWCSVKTAVTLAVVVFVSFVVPALPASTLLLASSSGESPDDGPALVRRINDEGQYVAAVEVLHQPEWTTLGWSSPWVSRTTEYTMIPEDVILEFAQEFYVPSDFKVELALFVVLAAFTSYSTLNGFQLTEPIFFPGESCANQPPGVPGCVEPLVVDVTPYLLAGKNVFVSQALGSGGSGIAQAWEFNVFGNFPPSHAVPEPAYMAAVGGSLAAILLNRYRHRSMSRRERG